MKITEIKIFKVSIGGRNPVLVLGIHVGMSCDEQLSDLCLPIPGSPV